MIQSSGSALRVAALLNLGDRAAEMRPETDLGSGGSLSELAIDIRNLDVETPTGMVTPAILAIM